MSEEVSCWLSYLCNSEDDMRFLGVYPRPASRVASFAGRMLREISHVNLDSSIEIVELRLGIIDNAS